MASQTEIANRALSKIGAQRILDFSDDTKEARAVTAAWASVRDSELRARSWNFSIERTELAALEDAPSWGYDYQYQVPSDFLRVVQVNDLYSVQNLVNYRNSDTAPYKLEGNKILTNEDAPLKLRYIKRVEDTTQWDAAFVEAFACRLAAELCEEITQSGTKRQLAWDDYKRAVADAVRANAIEVPPSALPDDSWIISRL
jgi:hypothetical protein